MLGLAACATQPPRTAAIVLPPPPPPPPIDPAQQEAIRLSQLRPIAVPHVRRPPLDLSGRKETGRASFYARRFSGRRTADGQRFNPNAAVAASKTLPIGTTAKVINLATGKAATVTVNDRGPYIESRMLDVSPAIAVRLGMERSGTAPVLVEPISIPQPDGAVKLGAGAATASSHKIKEAMKATYRTMSAAGIVVADR